MSIKSGQSVTVLFSTAHATTGAAANADALPVGTLYVNGVANAAVVTVTNLVMGLYRVAVTLPTMAAGAVASLRIAATVAGVAAEAVVWQDAVDTVWMSEIPLGIAVAVWDYLIASWGAVTTAGGYIMSRLGLITADGVSVIAPVAVGGNVTTIQGDDYALADGRALVWPVMTTANIVGGTVAVVLQHAGSYTGTVVDATTVRLELTRTQTRAIPEGARRFQVIVTQAAGLGGDVITVVDAQWTSICRVSV